MKEERNCGVNTSRNTQLHPLIRSPHYNITVQKRRDWNSRRFSGRRIFFYDHRGLDSRKIIIMSSDQWTCSVLYPAYVKQSSTLPLLGVIRLQERTDGVPIERKRTGLFTSCWKFFVFSASVSVYYVLRHCDRNKNNIISLLLSSETNTTATSVGQ